MRVGGRGCGPRFVGAGAEGLCGGGELQVRLDADDGLVAGLMDGKREMEGERRSGSGRRERKLARERKKPSYQHVLARFGRCLGRGGRAGSQVAGLTRGGGDAAAPGGAGVGEAGRHSGGGGRWAVEQRAAAWERSGMGRPGARRQRAGALHGQEGCGGSQAEQRGGVGEEAAEERRSHRETRKSEQPERKGRAFLTL